MAERNHYEVLGVSRIATAEELHAHYLIKLQQVHPDHNAGDDDGAHERTIEVVTAYQVLNDPDQRLLYDFRVSNAFVYEGLTPGQRVLVNKERKEAETCFAAGVRALKSDEPAKAVEQFKAALKAEPAYSAASYNLALLGALLGNTNFSIDILSRSLKTNAEQPDLLRLRKAITRTFLS